MRSFLLTFLLSALMTNVFSQTAMKLSSSSAEKVLSGKYNPAPYQSTLSSPAQLTKDLYDNISPDSLKADIIKLASFGNRNSGSDTVSSARGIGAARRWIYGKFAEYAKKQNSRLIPSYLYFKLDMCGMPEHKDILAVLPGSDTSSHEIIIIEGHVDSRCEDNCDTGCVAQGVEDNASGTALVMELARVMSGHNYPHTIVFLVTTGEEQGLYGAKALADYLKQQKIPVKGVLNNDVIGGVICGHTSSPPSCPGYGDIDSTHVRIFSSGGYNSPSKGLARFTKLEYEEMLMPLMKVPMEVLLMTPEDRTGRGGDHIPFRQDGYAAIRFTAANENGDANSSAPGYQDRQHSTRDVPGLDLNADGKIDSYFVDFHYLARNTAINGTVALMMAIGPDHEPMFSIGLDGNKLKVDISDPENSPAYRIAVRSTSYDWDTVYTLSGSKSGSFLLQKGGMLFVSVASVDKQGVEGLFNTEKFISYNSIREDKESPSAITLLQNIPNPFEEATNIGILVKKEIPGMTTAQIRIADTNGKELQTIQVNLMEGMNEVLFKRPKGQNGTLIYSLIINGQALQSKRMIIAY